MSLNTILSDSQIHSIIADYLINHQERFKEEFSWLISDKDLFIYNHPEMRDEILAEFESVLKKEIAQDLVKNLNLNQCGVIMTLQDINLRQYLGE